MGVEQLVRMRFVLLETYDTGSTHRYFHTFERRTTDLRAHSIAMYHVDLRINGSSKRIMKKRDDSSDED